jgi:ABC-2 type transport system permease protein
MKALLLKELNAFFGSLIGYLVVSLFLLFNGLYLWFMQGDLNILDSGYANLDGFFAISPYMFLFLCSAATMRMFSEEERSGTIELLVSRPMSYWQICAAKYAASVILCSIALLPCLVYFVSIYLLASPMGNIDTGGLWGAFIGLFFLYAAFCSIGLMASSATSNQIVAFLVSIGTGFLFLSGFGALASSIAYGPLQKAVYGLGIWPHYANMSKGVLDMRDIAYFASLSAFFIYAAVLAIKMRRQ